VPLFLIRHAVAGTRDVRDPRDDQRALDADGRRRANDIGVELAHRGIEAIYSSPALRCQQTVVPLAQALNLEVQPVAELFEGSSSSRSIAFVRSFTERCVVLCSHGDVIPDVLRNLEVGGTRIMGTGCAKGSIWELDNSTDRIESANYLGITSTPM